MSRVQCVPSRVTFRVLIASILAALATTAAAEQETAVEPEVAGHLGHKVVAPPGTDLGLPFSPGILAGDFLFLSGAIGNKPGTIEVAGDAAAQTRQTLENLEAVLDAAGMDFSRVVDATVFLSDARHFRAMGEVYAEFLGETLPARTTVEADVAIPGALTEIALVAARPGVEIVRITPEGWPATSGRFAWGVRAGDTVFIAGMVSSDPATGNLVPGDVAGQTTQAMKNVGAVLDAAGMGYDDLAVCNVYLADARGYDAMNDAYGAFFQDAPPPARATVRARLADPILSVEIQCRAARGERRAVAPAGSTPSGRPLSAAIRAGDRLWLSGMVGRGPDGYPAGVEAQTRVALARLAATLDAAGMSFRDVEMAQVYLADIRHYAAMNAVYREVVGSPPPARATVGSPLMSPEALVEIQMTASPATAGEPDR